MTRRWTSARRHLKSRDSILGDVITRVGPCTLEPGGDPFVVLARSIIAQLISTAAAQTIFSRLLTLVGDAGLSVHSLATLTDEQLRSVGLSPAKIAGVREVAVRATDGRLPLADLGSSSDEQIATALTAIKGIGPWTVTMFLIFGLGRPDVLPVGDLGLRAGVRDIYGLDDLPGAGDLTALAEPWRPWRSIGTWYVWRGWDAVKRAN